MSVDYVNSISLHSVYNKQTIGTSPSQSLMSTRSVQTVIYARVSFTDDEVDAFRELAKANGLHYQDERDAIIALAMSKIPDVNTAYVKTRDVICDLSTLS